MTTTVQRILMDKDIDIFQAIKTIQQRRTQFVDTFVSTTNVHTMCTRLFLNCTRQQKVRLAEFEQCVQDIH